MSSLGHHSDVGFFEADSGLRTKVVEPAQEIGAVAAVEPIASIVQLSSGLRGREPKVAGCRFAVGNLVVAVDVTACVL